MAKEVSIDSEECIGCQSCVEICPEVFAFNESIEKAYVLKPDGGEVGCVEEAVETCPVNCIEIT